MKESNMFTRVVKVGGSLLDLPDLSERLQVWLGQQSPACKILLAGGGTIVDEIRRWHEAKPLDERVAHGMSIEAMNITARLLIQALPSAELVEYYAELELMHDAQPLLVFAPLEWLRQEEPAQSGTPLPESWDVTSDSIAARLAICLNADELVLLKSTDPPSDDLQALAEVGYIDKFLPRLESELPPWLIVNLRRKDMSF